LLFCCAFACLCLFFFFSSRRRHTRSKRDWSSDVCSSDLAFSVCPVRPDTQKKRSTQEGVKRLTPDSERKPAEVSRAHLRGTLTGSLRPRAPGSDGGSVCSREDRRSWVTSV